jgi:8-oxo-dGTP pyrophosphatase MutT (NUDIX family)
MVPGDRLRSALSTALDRDPAPSPGPRDRLAAVVAPIVETPEPSLIFTLRASDLSRHAGEISFPGGLQDAHETLRATALREVFEELGLDAASIELLGALPSVHTFVTGILVVPFVGLLSSEATFTVNHGEIAEVLTLPIAGLAAVERSVEIDRGGARVWRGFAYELDGHTIWGATGWMLHSLLEVLREEAAWLIPA